MNFKDKLTLFLHKSKALKVYLYTKDKRITAHIVLPKDGKFTLNGKGYVVNPDRIFMEKSIPCSVYTVETAEPVDVLGTNEKSKLSSEDFYNAIEANVVQEIIRSSEGDNKEQLQMAVIAGGMAVLAVAGGVYYLSGMIEPLMMEINEIREILVELQTEISKLR